MKQMVDGKMMTAMEKRLSYILLATIALASCQQELENISPVAESMPFIGETEAFDADTKTTLDEGRVLWKRGDQVSIFAGKTINGQYQVTDDSEGQTSASYYNVSTPGFVSSVDISNNVAFYPYKAGNSLTNNGNAYVLSTIVPADQEYSEDSFGDTAFLMTAVTSSVSDYNLKFKNVLGGLKLLLKGTGKIASICIRGNSGEILCGPAKVTISPNENPTIDVTDVSATVVTLNCSEGVQLSNTFATTFIIALPPMTMTNGFTVIVKDTNGYQMEIPTTRTQTITRSSLLCMPTVEYVGEDPELSKPFTITSSGSTIVWISKGGSPYDVSLEYRTESDAWSNYSFGKKISLADGMTLQFRAGEDGNANFSQSLSNSCRLNVDGTGTISASGNIMSLLDGEMSRVYLTDGAFDAFFRGCKQLVDASDLRLPATALASKCYEYMFSSCPNLKSAPALPATKLAEYCYNWMFQGCSSLTVAPELPAGKLAKGCYAQMFMDCTCLVNAPKLPAETLAPSCYFGMFWGCKSIYTAPELPAETLETNCYMSMFHDCVCLSKAPVLPATNLVTGCYQHMFEGCSCLSYVKAMFILGAGTTDTAPTYYWLSGVAGNGTFVKNKDAKWDVRGISGVPKSWTIVTE